jgi:pyruvate/2-oxoglutarate dehydrogenase complex dihydrolipoamide dehydrogenase (E3) component/uncharacterized membrane protein YdjX (TVP38/TMEM64 family)
MTTFDKNKNPSKTNSKKILLFVVLLLFIISLIIIFPKNYLHLEYLQQNITMFRQQVDKNLTLSVIIYIVLYVLVSVFAIPGAAVLTLLSGALFGFSLGFAASIVGSTLGAIGAFIVTRYLIGDYINQKFILHSQKIKKEFEKNGDAYLLTLRIVPIFPFFLVNILMGLTPIRFKNYMIISCLGMMPASAVYTYAGLSFAHLKSIEGILTPPIFIAFFLLGLLPHFGRMIIWNFNRHRLYKPFIKPKRFQYNAVVIGAGSAGLVTANICSTLGAKVAIIEKDSMGGDCLNRGCVPSKTLIHSSRLAHSISKSQGFGIELKDSVYNFAQTMKNIKETIKKIEPNDSIARYESLGVHCFSGEAKIISPWEVLINNKTITTKNIVIATGSSPRKLDVPGVASIEPLTSDTFWNLIKRPDHLVVIGGGAIGCEISQAMVRLGSKVTMLVRGKKLLEEVESSASLILERALKDEGVEIHFNTQVTSFEKTHELKMVYYKQNEEQLNMTFDEVLLAIGRKSSVSTLSDTLKFDLNENGTLKTNDYLQTNYHNIYACGDITGKFQFTHFASHQAKYVALNIVFGLLKKFKVDNSFVPKCIYTSPEIASVGKSEFELKENGTEFDEAIFFMKDLDRAVIEKEENGYVKILTTKKSGKILGVTIVGAQASLMIQEFILAMENGLTLDKILQSIHPYPGFNEANKFAAGAWKKNQLTPRKIKWLERFNQLFLK